MNGLFYTTLSHFCSFLTSWLEKQQQPEWDTVPLLCTPPHQTRELTHLENLLSDSPQWAHSVSSRPPSSIPEAWVVDLPVSAWWQPQGREGSVSGPSDRSARQCHCHTFWGVLGRHRATVRCPFPTAGVSVSALCCAVQPPLCILAPALERSVREDLLTASGC